MYYLGIDLGGTNIAVGIVDENNQIIARLPLKQSWKTPSRWRTLWLKRPMPL